MLQRVGRGVVPRVRGRAAVPAASLRSGKWESLHVTASASDVRSKRQGESAIPANPDEVRAHPDALVRCLGAEMQIPDRAR